MAVTITGGIASLSTASGGFGITGLAGATLTLTPRHPSGTVPSVAILTDAVLPEARPSVIALSSAGLIPADTVIRASGALRPAGCYYTAVWTLGAGTDGEAVLESYDLLIGPEGGTCDVTDPRHRLGAGGFPVLAGWPPDLAPVPVHVGEGTP